MAKVISLHKEIKRNQKEMKGQGLGCLAASIDVHPLMQLVAIRVVLSVKDGKTTDYRGQKNFLAVIVGPSKK